MEGNVGTSCMTLIWNTVVVLAGWLWCAMRGVQGVWCVECPRGDLNILAGITNSENSTVVNFINTKRWCLKCQIMPKMAFIGQTNGIP